MRTQEPDAGFVPEKGQTECRVLNVRGVNKLTMVLIADVPQEEVFQIAAELWTLSPLSILTIAGVAFVILAFTGLYYAHKYFECCSRQREPYQDSRGCGRRWKFAVQHVFPAILFVATMATDLWYILTVPTSSLIFLYLQLVSLLLP